MECFVVIPSYNEGTKIANVILGLKNNGFTKIIVVDDGSKDATAEVAKANGAVVLKHVVNRGQGAALQTGNTYALKHGADAVVHFDADNQHDPADIKPALQLLEEKKLDVVLGSRFLKSSSVPWSKKYFILPLARFVTFLFGGIYLSDAHNGFRVLSRNALEKITITQAGMAHASEIVGKIKKNNLKFAEMPVTIRYHEYGQGLWGGVKVVIDLIKSFIF